MINAFVHLAPWVALDLYSLTVLGVILFSTLRVRGRATIRERTFRHAVVYAMFLTVCHSTMSVGEDMGLRWLQELGTTLSFAFNPGILLYWIIYALTFFGEFVDTAEVAHEQGREQWVVRIFLTVNNVVAFSNHWTHLYFSYDEAGAYHRGPLFLARYGCCVVIVLLAMGALFRARAQIGRQTLPWLLLTPLLPTIGALLQPRTHMLGLELVGFTLACMMLHLFVQGRVTDTDALTGLANRRELERRFDHLRDRVQSRPFGAVMLDVDRFKLINDEYGHACGDEALVVVAQAMAHAFGAGSTLVRLSGDEFIALVPDCDKEGLAWLAGDLRADITRIAKERNLPSAIEVSLGLDMYDPERFSGQVDFTQHLDEQLYAEKAAKGALREA